MQKEKQKILEKVVISFGPEHSPLDKRQVELALKEMVETKKEKPDILVFAAFHFDPEASRLINEYEFKKDESRSDSNEYGLTNC